MTHQRTHAEELEAAIRAVNPPGWFVAADIPGWRDHMGAGSIQTLRHRGTLAARDLRYGDPRRTIGARFEYLLLT